MWRADALERRHRGSWRPVLRLGPDSGRVGQSRDRRRVSCDCGRGQCKCSAGRWHARQHGHRAAGGPPSGLPGGGLETRARNRPGGGARMRARGGGERNRQVDLARASPGPRLGECNAGRRRSSAATGSAPGPWPQRETDPRLGRGLARARARPRRGRRAWRLDLSHLQPSAGRSFAEFDGRFSSALGARRHRGCPGRGQCRPESRGCTGGARFGAACGGAAPCGSAATGLRQVGEQSAAAQLAFQMEFLFGSSRNRNSPNRPRVQRRLHSPGPHHRSRTEPPPPQHPAGAVSPGRSEALLGRGALRARPSVGFCDPAAQRGHWALQGRLARPGAGSPPRAGRAAPLAEPRTPAIPPGALAFAGSGRKPARRGRPVATNRMSGLSVRPTRPGSDARVDRGAGSPQTAARPRVRPRPGECPGAAAAAAAARRGVR